MGNKIISIVTITVMILIFSLLVSFISYDMQIQRSQKVVKEFTELIQYNGIITEQEYYNIMQNLPIRGSRLEITQIRTLDDGTLDIWYTPDIIGLEMSSSGGVNTTGDGLLGDSYYQFSRGDLVKIDLYDINRSILDVMSNSLFGKGSSSVKLIASDAGVVVNVKDY